MSVRAGILTNLEVNMATLHATEGIPFYDARVATFTDPGEALPKYLMAPVLEVTNYSATITWGDGTGPYPATLVHGFMGIDVLGTHVYTEHGQYPVLVQVTDLVDGSSGTNNLPVKVCDARLLHVRGAQLPATEAMGFSNLVVATFVDENPYGTTDDFSATIDWGDRGPTSAGIVVENESGGFAIVGSHTYEHKGSYCYGVKISDIGGSHAYALGTVRVSDAPIIATGVDLTLIEGAPFAGTVATFTHSDTNAGEGEFAAVISWGDNPGAPPLAGLVLSTGVPGSFAVYGEHTFTQAGSYPLGVDIFSRGGSTNHVGATATVGDAELKAIGVPVATTEGFAIDTVVAAFTDANPYAITDDFLAAIDWGDGTEPSEGSVAINGAGGFTVSGTHVYVNEGTFRITVVINDVGGATASAATTATISDAKLVVSAASFSQVEGVPFTNVIATFTDENPLLDLDHLTAVIDWGDGGTSQGLITLVEQKGVIVGRTYNVAGSHVYTSWDSYTFRVTVNDVGGSSDSAIATADISDAPLSSVPRVITPTEGTSFMAVVANFTDANPYGTTNQFTASLLWGDGTTTSGTIIPNTAVNTGYAEFVVLGGHQYGNQGLYPIRVTIQSDGTSHTIANGAAVTADAPMIGTGKTISVVKGVPFTQVVANCVDTDTTPEPETTYACIIDWGDGSTSTGMVSEGDEDGYTVSGSHTYAQAGSYVVLATIDNMQTFVSTTARSTAVVSETPAANLTSQFVIKATRAVLNKRTGIYRQTVMIKNPTGQRVTGPVSLVLDSLSSGVSLVNKDGETLTPGAAPVGSPYKNVMLPRNNVFTGHSVRNVVLYFRSSAASITYNPRVLAGPGAR